jgi:hypothetical protein
MGWPPRASFERTDRMLLFMGLASLVVSYRQIFGLLHCFIGWLGREIGYKPVYRSASVM